MLKKDTHLYNNNINIATCVSVVLVSVLVESKRINLTCMELPLSLLKWIFIIILTLARSFYVIVTYWIAVSKYREDCKHIVYCIRITNNDKTDIFFVQDVLRYYYLINQDRTSKIRRRQQNKLRSRNTNNKSMNSRTRWWKRRISTTIGKKKFPADLNYLRTVMYQYISALMENILLLLLRNKWISQTLVIVVMIGNETKQCISNLLNHVKWSLHTGESKANKRS